MELAEFEKASRFWTDKEKDLKRMDNEELLTHAEKFLNDHNTCALATGSGDFVRCTPIEYSYIDKSLWMLSEGGLKFRALGANSNVSIAIYDNYEKFGKIKGMQISGKAEMIEPFSTDYLKVLEYKKIPVEALKKLDFSINLIKVNIVRIDLLNSEFKKEGFDLRQFIEF